MKAQACLFFYGGVGGKCAIRERVNLERVKEILVEHIRKGYKFVSGSIDVEDTLPDMTDDQVRELIITISKTLIGPNIHVPSYLLQPPVITTHEMYDRVNGVRVRVAGFRATEVGEGGRYSHVIVIVISITGWMIPIENMFNALRKLEEKAIPVITLYKV